MPIIAPTTIGLEVVTDDLRAAIHEPGPKGWHDATVATVQRDGVIIALNTDSLWRITLGDTATPARILACMMRSAMTWAAGRHARLLMPGPDVLAALANAPERTREAER